MEERCKFEHTLFKDMKCRVFKLMVVVESAIGMETHMVVLVLGVGFYFCYRLMIICFQIQNLITIPIPPITPV